MILVCSYFLIESGRPSFLTIVPILLNILRKFCLLSLQKLKAILHILDNGELLDPTLSKLRG